MGLVLPYWIVESERGSTTGPGLAPPAAFVVIGAAITAAGLLVTLAAIRLFILIGNGTIMPWDPTRKLVIAGLYRHVRNPMILGLIITLLGEAIWFASPGIALLAVLNFVVNTIYFIYSEEPGLERRFGAEYVEYKKNVPRWIPRREPWHPA